MASSGKIVALAKAGSEMQIGSALLGDEIFIVLGSTVLVEGCVMLDRFKIYEVIFSSSVQPASLYVIILDWVRHLIKTAWWTLWKLNDCTE